MSDSAPSMPAAEPRPGEGPTDTAGLPDNSPSRESSFGPEPGGLAPPSAPPPRYILASILFLLTFLTTTTLGAIFHTLTQTDRSTSLDLLIGPRVISAIWGNADALANGLAFSIPLLCILLSHELGHYLACRRYGIASTLPYFLPSPVALGTFGAFIRIRGRIPSRRELFDVGLAGPIAGFLALLPFLALGIWWSSPAIVHHATSRTADAYLLQTGSSAAVELAARLFHGPIGPA